VAFVDLHEHLSLVDLSQIRHLRDSGQHHLRSIFSPAMFRDFRIAQRGDESPPVEKPCQTVARAAAQRRADPNVVIIHHGCLRGGTIHSSTSPSVATPSIHPRIVPACQTHTTPPHDASPSLDLKDAVEFQRCQVFPPPGAGALAKRKLRCAKPALPPMTRSDQF
jgi:hypothetical protein